MRRRALRSAAVETEIEALLEGSASTCTRLRPSASWAPVGVRLVLGAA